MKGYNKIAMMLELTVNVQLIVRFFFLENVFGHSMNGPKLKNAVFYIFQKRFGILVFFFLLKSYWECFVLTKV
jgi:hypothetical protein